MKIRPEEITSILKQRIEDYDAETELAEVGTVLQVGDGLARIYGLENCMAMEMLELEHGVTGIAFNLEEDNVGSPLFGEWEAVAEGEPVRRTGKVVSVPVGDALIGRIVNPLGQPLDGQGPKSTAPTLSDSRFRASPVTSCGSSSSSIDLQLSRPWARAMPSLTSSTVPTSSTSSALRSAASISRRRMSLISPGRSVVSVAIGRG